MFIDEMNLHLRAGRGGDGVERWRHEKGKEYGGPSGGNGGKGGDIYVVAVKDIGILASYRNTKEFSAPNGVPGGKDRQRGEGGYDLEIKLPVGSRITNQTTGHVIELLEEGQKVLLLKGGRGGLGNEHFKSSTNTNPTETTPGELGEEADFHIELLLVVDVGVVGLPNAGKSSLLNALTSAKSKVGDFPFTTLEPSLGDFHGIIIADIPGLIEGAAEGRGLGHKFLRHIERTRTLVHCISCEVEDPVESYKLVRKELELYNKEIMDKPEVVLLTKTDMVSEEEVESRLAMLRVVSDNVHTISVLDDDKVKSFGDYMVKSLRS